MMHTKKSLILFFNKLDDVPVDFSRFWDLIFFYSFVALSGGRGYKLLGLIVRFLPVFFDK